MSALGWLLIAGAVAVVALLGLARLARQATAAAFVGECDAVLAASGAQRCELAVGLLRHLRRVKPEPRIHEVWERIELPLVEALPDCPPPLKPIVIKHLDGLYQVCRNREYQRRIMTLRNSLID